MTVDSEVRQKFEAWWKSATEGVESLVGLSVNQFDAFEAGMRAGEIARWIPVEEKLPGEGTKVLTWFREYAGSQSPYIHRFAEICAGHWRPEGGSGNFDDRVTHWQPLPAAPEEKPDNSPRKGLMHVTHGDVRRCIAGDHSECTNERGPR